MPAQARLHRHQPIEACGIHRPGRERAIQQGPKRAPLDRRWRQHRWAFGGTVRLYPQRAREARPHGSQIIGEPVEAMAQIGEEAAHQVIHHRGHCALRATREPCGIYELRDADSTNVAASTTLVRRADTVVAWSPWLPHST